MTNVDLAQLDRVFSVDRIQPLSERRRSGGAPRRRPAWFTAARAAALGAIALLGYVSLSGLAAEVWFLAVATASVMCFFVGISRHPTGRWSWGMVGAGFLLFLVGALLFTLNHFVFRSDAFPSSADAAALAGYPVIAAGLAALVRRGNAGNGSMIDVGIVVTPFAVAAFVYIIQPTAGFGVTVLEKTVSAAYPIGALICLAVLVRLVAGLSADGAEGTTGQGTQPALAILIASLVALLLGDIIFFWSALSYSYVSGGWSDGVYLVSFVALGAAAMDCSIAEIGRPRPVGEVTLSRSRLVLLAFAASSTPTILAVQWLRSAPMAVPLVVAGSIVSIALVVARMGGLVQALEASRSQLRFDATHDALTGLPNRQLFAARFDEMLRTGEPGALLFVDLDRFKLINDTLGHHEGDQVLIEVAEILKAGIRGSDTVARLSGDEFVVLIPATDDAQVMLVAQRLVSSVRVIRLADGDTITVTASVGLAMWPANTRPERAGQLMKAADDAMYTAKHLAGGQLAIAAR